MSLGHYILRGREVVNCDHLSLTEWAQAYGEQGNRQLGDTTINNVRISTVFLGLDHSWGGGRPILFETMVFGGTLNQTQVRYGTYDEAERGHKRMVHRVRLAEQSALERAITKVRRKAKRGG